MFKMYYYNEETGKETIEYGFASHIIKRTAELLNTYGIEVEFIFKVPFSFRAFHKCLTHKSFERKD